MTFGTFVLLSQEKLTFISLHCKINRYSIIKRRQGCASFGLPDSYRRMAIKTEAENIHLANELEEILHAR